MALMTMVGGASAVSAPVMADVGIPSPATIVLEAQSVVVGTFHVAGNSVYLDVQHTLKGVDVNAQRLTLVDPIKGLAFNMVEVAKAHQGKPIVALGDLESLAGRLTLRWLFASLWPSQPEFVTFPSAKFADCERFAKTVVAYEAACQKDVQQLAADLVAHASSVDKYAALDYANVAWAKCAQKAGGDLGKLVVWAMYAKVYNGSRDEYVDTQTISMLPLLPMSVAIGQVLAVAAKRASSAGLSRVEALFRARKMTRGKKLTAVQLEAVFQAHRSQLQREDGLVALRMFDSSTRAVADCADLTLGTILGHPLAPDDAKKGARARKALWAQEIAKL